MSNTFRKELELLINRHSAENGSDTPDFILADYLQDCLFAWDKAVVAREKWYGHPRKKIARALNCLEHASFDAGSMAARKILKGETNPAEALALEALNDATN